MRWAGIKNWLSGKLESSLLSLTRKISQVSFISSFNDLNSFRNEFTFRCPGKAFLGCLHLKPLKVLKACCLLFFSLNNCSSELLVRLYTSVVILTCASCQQSNLFKANNKFSISLLGPLLFKWIPLLITVIPRVFVWIVYKTNISFTAFIFYLCCLCI